MEKYQVILRPAAQRDLQKIVKPFYHRILKSLNDFKKNPWPRGVKKLTGQENEWRLRIGDYRILYEIDDMNKIVKIFRIAHRRDVYR